MSEASAPAKVILVGEHFVVEGVPAVAAAISLRARARVETSKFNYDEIVSENLGLSVRVIGNEIQGSPEAVKCLKPICTILNYMRDHYGLKDKVKITISSEIPPASGMGSSAAVAVATTAALSKFANLNLSLEEICNIAYKAEQIVHGKPSGIDNTVSTYGGIVVFKRGEKPVKIETNWSDYKLILADTGVPRRTGDMVRRVLALKAKYPTVLSKIYEAAEALVSEFVDALVKGDFEKAGTLMNVNHGLLSAIGVSIRELEELVYLARLNGAIGAKLTGAGGGGSIVALVRKRDSDKVIKALQGVAKKTFLVSVENVGVVAYE